MHLNKNYLKHLMSIKVMYVFVCLCVSITLNTFFGLHMKK